ncbi:MAG TPA: TonB-dependent receptor plug domain-containing protein, partial [Roseateles sp.]|uniref:TonB-dependent siderophore receptor n=1 Tax=Roseateles sp. TaxID=1971397 RepID=UPI002EDB266C
MAQPSFSLIGAATALLATSLASAQTLPQVSVTGKATEVVPGLAGFGDPPAKLPMQALSLSAERLDDLGIGQLSGITKLDASVSDAYNAVGYWSQLKVRGFDLDNRFNLRRDGLPISGETALSLANKAAVEVLKGSSGMQAGTSAPAGLVNLVVKRPLLDDATTLALGFIERGTVQASVDHSQRFGASREFGLRVNLAAARLDPTLRNSKGHSHTAALAADWRITPDTLVEAEVEFNRQSQPSQQGFSLLGDRLPDVRRIDPNLNLNNQPWSLPVVFDNTHASLRVQQKLSGGWRAQASLGIQRLRTDDRLAYAFGCSAADGSYYPSSFCPDGSYDMFDFRSENEHRDTTALDISASGPVQLAGLRHDLTVGGLSSQFKSRFQGQAYNYTGTGNIDGSAVTPAAPELTDENTNRDERSNELYLRDRIALTANTTAWLGLRHTRLHRESVRTDGSRPTNYAQGVTTPWIALSH